MSRSQLVAEHLPLLRRYARALTGSQQHGDEWVRMCVEVLLQQPDLLKSGATTKFDVFMVFHKLQHPFAALEPATSEAATRPDRRAPVKARPVSLQLPQLAVQVRRLVRPEPVRRNGAGAGLREHQGAVRGELTRNE